jgi:hypothetical protein
MPSPPTKVYGGRAEVRATPSCKSEGLFRSANNCAWSGIPRSRADRMCSGYARIDAFDPTRALLSLNDRMACPAEAPVSVVGLSNIRAAFGCSKCV